MTTIFLAHVLDWDVFEADYIDGKLLMGEAVRGHVAWTFSAAPTVEQISAMQSIIVQEMNEARCADEDPEDAVHGHWVSVADNEWRLMDDEEDDFILAILLIDERELDTIN